MYHSNRSHNRMGDKVSKAQSVWDDIVKKANFYATKKAEELGVARPDLWWEYLISPKMVENIDESNRWEPGYIPQGRATPFTRSMSDRLFMLEEPPASEIGWHETGEKTYKAKHAGHPVTSAIKPIIKKEDFVDDAFPQLYAEYNTRIGGGTQAPKNYLSGMRMQEGGQFGMDPEDIRKTTSPIDETYRGNPDRNRLIRYFIYDPEYTAQNPQTFPRRTFDVGGLSLDKYQHKPEHWYYMQRQDPQLRAANHGRPFQALKAVDNPYYYKNIAKTAGKGIIEKLGKAAKFIAPNALDAPLFILGRLAEAEAAKIPEYTPKFAAAVADAAQNAAQNRLSSTKEVDDAIRKTQKKNPGTPKMESESGHYHRMIKDLRERELINNFNKMAITPSDKTYVKQIMWK